MTKSRPVIGTLLADGARLMIACCAAAGVVPASHAIKIDARSRGERDIMTPRRLQLLHTAVAAAAALVASRLDLAGSCSGGGGDDRTCGYQSLRARINAQIHTF